VAKRGRPRSPRAASARIVNVKMRLYSGEDDDLIDFFASIPRRLRAAMVRQALRSGVQSSCGETLNREDELFEALEAFVD
jgi:hypothetical protein